MSAFVGETIAWSNVLKSARAKCALSLGTVQLQLKNENKIQTAYPQMALPNIYIYCC